MKSVKVLVLAAEHIVGSKDAPEATWIELRNLLSDMEVYASSIEELLGNLEKKLKKLIYIDKLKEIKRSELITVSGFIVEMGEIVRFYNPRQLQKLTGNAIVTNSSDNITEKAGLATETGNA